MTMMIFGELQAAVKQDLQSLKSALDKLDVFVTKVVDVIIQIHMVEIALFLYGDKTTVVGQPLVNHRPLYVSNMKGRKSG